MELIRLRDSSGKIFDTAMKLYEKSYEIRAEVI